MSLRKQSVISSPDVNQRCSGCSQSQGDRRRSETTQLVAQLKQCGQKKDLERGKLLHLEAVESGCYKVIYVANTLISMYSKCGDMHQARCVFDQTVQRSVVSWNALITGYVDNGESMLALQIFDRMDTAPDCATFVGVLKACTCLATWSKFDNKKYVLRKGMSIHRHAKELGLDENVLVASSLVVMYSKLGDMLRARIIFDGMTNRDVVAWTALIDGYVENGECSLAMEVFRSMDCAPDRVTFVSALKACAVLAELETGLALHRQVREQGFEMDIFVANTLVDMYCKCGAMQRARVVFDGMRRRNVISWTALIDGYVENGQSFIALEAYKNMSCAPNHITFVAALKACACLGALDTGQRIHDRVCELGLEQYEMLPNSLVDLYSKCGDMHAAEDVFNRMHSRDIISWNSLIGGYSSLGDADQVFVLVKRMLESGLQLDSVTMLLILAACSHAGMVDKGRWYFQAMTPKFNIQPTVKHYACMVGLLGRSNKLDEALALIKRMSFEADSVVWMALLGACRKWSNVEIGEVAFGSIVALNIDDESIATAYVLMGNIYEKLGMQHKGEEMKAKGKTLTGEKKKKKSGETFWCDRQGNMQNCSLVDDTIFKVKDKLKALLECSK